MKEDNIDTLRQKDVNLREAISMEEMERPQMPSDLNARLMQRVAKEVNKKKAHSRIIWPWLAAACVAGVVAIFLTPPKTNEQCQLIASYRHYKMTQKPYVCNMDEAYHRKSFEDEERVMRGRYNKLLNELETNEE
ncbi:MAG: hypothetical protein IJP82_09280 [Bacteroidaceae bacterium]|nr:hypothetical protein [Bacteroidaceae bacterium]